MGYNRVVKESNLTIPKARFEEARERLYDLGFSGKNLRHAFGRARWLGSYSEHGQGEVFTIDSYDGDWWGESEAAAISALGDLFEPDGVITFIGEDQKLWAWRVNHKGHVFVEVAVRLAVDDVEPTSEFLERVVMRPSGDLSTTDAAGTPRPTSAQLARIAYEHEQPFQIGTLLEFGTEIVPWVDGVHDDSNVVMQVWDKEWGGGDHECEGWEPRAIAQLLQERWPRKTAFTLHDIEQLVDDPSSPADKIAIRPNLSRDDLINLVTGELSEESRTREGTTRRANVAQATQAHIGTIDEHLDHGATNSAPVLEL